MIAGEYATRAQADAAAAGIVLGDLQGFVVAATSDFEGMTPGRYLVMSAFRTAQGAAEFEELVTMAGYGPMRRAVAVYRGSSWIGLGQEASPDGSGPLRGPHRGDGEELGRCLLYTSPSPRDGLLSRMPSSA